MLSFLQFLITEEENKFHGVILPNGKSHEQHHGYSPAIHDEHAKKHGFKSAKDLVEKGGVRFASYLGSVDYGPGHRLEYEYKHPSAHKHIIQHIKDHPMSGGYSIVRKGKTNLPAGKDDTFTEHKTAADAIRHLSKVEESVQPATTQPKLPTTLRPATANGMVLNQRPPAYKMPGQSVQLQPQKPAKTVQQKPLKAPKPKSVTESEPMTTGMQPKVLAPAPRSAQSKPNGSQKDPQQPQPIRVAKPASTTQRPAPVRPVQHSVAQKPKTTAINKEYYPESVTFQKRTTGEFEVLFNGHPTEYSIINGSKGASGFGQNMYGIAKQSNPTRWIGSLQACKKSLIFTLEKRALHQESEVTPDPLKKRDLRNFSFDKWNPEGILGSPNGSG